MFKNVIHVTQLTLTSPTKNNISYGVYRIPDALPADRILEIFWNDLFSGSDLISQLLYIPLLLCVDACGDGPWNRDFLEDTP